MVRHLFGSRWLTKRPSTRRRRRESAIARRGAPLGSLAYAGASFEPLEGRALLATFAQGDFVVLGINSANPDSFTFANLKAMDGGDVITFTDNGFSSATVGRTGEGFLTFTAPAGGVSAGSTFTWTNGMTVAGTPWSSGSPTNFSFNGNGDQLYIFSGSSSDWATQSGITLLFGMNYGTALNTTGATASASNTVRPTALQLAWLNLPSTTNANTYYSGTGLAATTVGLSGLAAEIVTKVTTSSEWFGNGASASTFPAYTVAVSAGTTAPLLAAAPTSTANASSSATLGGEVTSSGGSPITERGVIYALTSVNATPEINGTGVVKVAAGTNGIGVFTVPVTGLAGGSGYSFRAYATNAIGTTYSNVGTFTTTSGATAPTVTAPTATGITNVSSTLGGTIVGDGDSPITERGIVLAETGVNTDPTIGGTGVTQLTASGTTGVFTVGATGLTALTGYTYKAYATNAVGTTYTSAATFTTITTPTVSTPTKTSISYTAATLGGTVANDGTGTVTERGVVYSLSSVNADPVISGTGVTKLAAGAGGIGTFTTRPTGLQASSVYTFKAYATNAAGTTYTAVDTFTTPATPIAQWTFDDSTTNIAVGTGTASVVGGTTGSFSTSGNPGSAWSTTSYAPQGTGDKTRGVQFNVSASRATPSSFAFDQRFSNSSANTGVVQYTLDASATTPVWVDLGTYTVTAGDTWYPQTFSLAGITGMANNPALGFRILAAFAPSTTAYTGATATTTYSTSGTWRFDNVTLNGDPIPAVLPTVTTPTATAVSHAGATLGGNVTADGFANVTERGVVYALTSDSATPEIGGTGVTRVAAATGGTGVFTAAVTGLAASSGYSYRAYAINSVGTAYSATDTFTSLAAPTAPVVALDSPPSTAVTTAAATLAAAVAGDGGAAILERGFVYAATATNGDPLINGTGVTRVTVTGTTGALTTGLTGLDAATEYSFKAYATNSVGTTYTAVGTFATLAPTTTVLTGISPLNATTGQSVTFAGTVTAGAGAATPAGTVEIRVGGPSGALLASTSTIGGSGVNGTFSIATTSIPIGTYAGLQAFFIPAAGFAASTSAAFGSTLAVTAAPLTPGNLLVLRVGDGTSALGTAAAAVSLLEITTAGMVVQVIPVTTSGGSALTMRGDSSTEGVLSLSGDRQSITFGGYRANVLTANVSTAATAAPRVIGRIDSAASVNTAQALTGAFLGDSFRSVATDDGTNFWLSGAGESNTGGIQHAAGSSATTTTALTDLVNPNTRQVAVLDGNLFTSSGSSAPGVSAFQVGTGLPTTGQQTLTNAGLPSASSQYQSFFYADLNAGVSWRNTGYDTLYVTNSSSGGLALRKFSFVINAGVGAWVDNGSINLTGASNVTGFTTAGTVTLYVTTSTAGTGGIKTLTDNTGYNASIASLSLADLTTPVVAGTNYALRGIAFVPRAGIATTTAITSVTPTVVEQGQQVTFTATVAAASGTATPTGTVQFRSGATVLAMAAITGSGATGTATVQTSSIPFATYTDITAQFVPDGNPSLNLFNPSTSAPFTTALVVEQPGVVTTSSISAISPATVAYNVPITFSGSVTTADSSTPTGTIEIRNGGPTGLLLGTTTTFTTSGGFEIVTSAPVPGGTYADVRAYFTGGTGFKNSSSAAFGTPLNVTFTTLGMGDIAFTAVRSNNLDAFSFVLLKDVIAGTAITFTDNAWTGSALASNEGSRTLTFTRAFTAGTVFDFEDLRADGTWRSGGNDFTGVTEAVTGGFALNSSGDNLFAYQGAPPTTGSAANWIAAYSSLAFLTTGSVSASTTFVPTAFTLGNTAFSPNLTTGHDAGIGNLGTVTGSPASIRAAIYSPTNWTATFTLPPPTTFTLAAGSPAISVTGSAAAFSTTYGTASTAQTFSISGVDLTADIVATAPAGFEVSRDGTTWGSTTTFAQAAGLASGTLRVRLAATAAVSGSYNSQSITIASTGANPFSIQTVASGNTVTPAALTVTATNVTKPFGVTLSGASGSAAFVAAGLVNGDTVGTVTIAYGTGSGALDAAGTYAAQVTASALTGGTFTAANYAVTYVPGDIVVTADPIALVTGTLAAFSTTYGTFSAAQTFSVTGYNLTGALSVAAPAGFEVSADGTTFQTTVTLTPTGGTVNAALVHVRIAAATPANPSLSGSVSVTGGGTPGSVTVAIPSSTISRKALSITGLTGDAKPYDRSTAATATGTAVLDGIVGSDVVSLTGTATFTFTTAAVGPNRPMTVGGYSLAGAAAGNYDLTLPALSAAITPAPLTVSGVTVTSKVYDGTTAATISGGTLAGVISGDDVSIGATGTYASAGVGPAIAVTPTLTGADAGNYELTLPTGVTGAISRRPVTITGIAIAPKMFDGLTTATITGTPALDNAVAGDVVTIDASGATASFTTASVGTGKSVTITGYAINGAAAGNYDFTQPTGVTGTILAPTFTRWTFDADTLTPSGVGTASVVGGVTATFSAGNGSGRAWNTTTYAAQSAENGQRGVQFMVSTLGRSDISFSFDHRASGTASRWAQVDYTLDGGQTWVANHWRNNGSLSPHDTYSTFTVDFGGVIGAGNNPGFGVRIVSIFSPQAFDQNNTAVAFAADTAYMRANAAAVYSPNSSAASGDYGASGTWRFDNVTFRGQPAPIVKAVAATDTLRIVTYNIASSGGDGLPRTGLDTVLQAIGTETVGAHTGRIDLLALQEVQSQAITTAAVVSSLNTAYGTTTYARGNVNGASTGSGTVGVVYDTASLTLLDETAIATGGPRQAMRYLFRPTAATGAESFYVYVAHFKSESDGSSQATRATEAAAIRANADALGPGASILYLGDFNLYSSSEAAYQTLIGAGNGQAFDPLNQPGNWSSNASFTGIHTQAPLNSAPSGLVGGGLDDRFDFQLVSGAVNSSGLGLRILPNSYHTFGNNGSVGLNGDIDSGSNTALAGLANRTTVLGLLGTVSDHLPVVADYAAPTTAAIAAMTTTYGTPSAASAFSVAAAGLTGSLTVTAPAGFELATSLSGAYTTAGITLSPTSGAVSTTVFVRLTGAAAGTFSGTISITGGGAATETLAIAASTVNRVVLTVSGAPTVSSRAYDGTMIATVSLNGATLTGIRGGDDVSLATAGQFASANAATGIAVTLMLAGVARDNYELTQPSGLTADISRATLTITAPSIASREYDGTTTAGTLSVGTLSGLVGSETVTVTGAAADYSSANADTYTGVVITYSLANGTNGGLAANYSLANGSATGLVTPRAITITAPSIASREYDGTTTAGTVTAGTPTNLVGSETLVITATAANYSTANVGTFTPVITYSLADGTGGGLATNYSLSSGTAFGVVTPKILSITAPTIADRDYDGTTTAGAVAIGTLSGFVGSETVTATGTAADYTSANANTYTGVAVTYTLTDGYYGGRAANYTLADGSATGVVTPKILSITAPSIASREYDGTTTAGTLTVGSLSGFVGSETVTVTGAAANYSSANADTYNGVVITYSLANGTNGGLAANYTLANGSATGLVTPRAITITANATSKTYGDADPAPLSFSYLTARRIAGDYFTGTLSRATGEDVANSPYAITQGTLSLGANYTITFVGAHLTITPKALTIIGLSAANKVYDGTTTASVSGSPTFAGLVSGESFAVSGAVTWAFADANAGTAKSIVGTGSYAAPNANYSVVQPALTANISTRAITITADAASKTYGDTEPALTYQITSGSLATGDGLTGALTRAAGENVGTYAISQGTLDASSNYTISFTGANLSITTKALTVSADTRTKVYGAVDPTLTYVATGLVGSDALTGALTRVAGENVGTYAISQGSLNAGSNYTISFTGADLVVTPKALSISGLSAANKVYDGTVSAPVSGTPAYTGLVSGESFAVSGAVTWAFADANVGTAKPISRIGNFAAPSANYTLTQPTGLAADITPKALTISSLSAANKVYDGTVSAPVSGTPAYSGLVNGESFAVSGAVTWAFADANVGTAKPISRIGSFAAPSANYTLTQPTGFAADITPKALAITGLAAASKVYDGTVSAPVSGTPAYSGLITGETFPVAGIVTWNFADANVGTAKPISRVGAFAAPSANYTLTQPTGFAADITPRPLTVAGAAAVDKVYDGTTAATISGATLVGAVAGDAVTVSGTGTFASPNAAAGIAVSPAFALGGSAAPNYTLTQPAGLTAAITPRSVTVRALDVVKNTGESLVGGSASTAFSAAGLLPGDTIGSVTIAYGPAAAAGTLGGRYAGQVVPSAATGGTFNPANYALTYTPGDIVVFTVNLPPAAVTLTNVVASLPENTPTVSAIRVADIVVADDGLGTNGLSLTGPDAAAFMIEQGALFLRAGTALDFESKTAYDVTVVVTDPEHPGLPLSAAYRLAVTGVNETPTTIALSAATIAENAVAGTIIGSFSTSDPDAGDSFTYTLVPGDGGADNALFTITGGQLVSAAPFNFEMQPSLSVRVRATDSAGASIEQVFTITVTDIDEPLRVEGVEPPPSGFYRVGETLRFTVVLTRPVQVTGRPTLQFGLGRNASIALFGTGRRTAAFVSGAGTNRLTFDYRITSRDNAEQVYLGGSVVSARNGITDADNARLDGRLPAANTLVPGVRIDSSAPRATGSVGMPSRGTYRVGDVLSFRVTFSEEVLVTGTPRLEVRIGQQTRQATYASGAGSRQLTFSYTVAAGDATVGRRGITVGRSIVARDGAAIADAAGNAAQLQLAGPYAAQVTVDGGSAAARAIQSRGLTTQRTRAAAFAGFTT